MPTILTSSSPNISLNSTTAASKVTLLLYADDYKFFSVITFSILFLVGFVGNILVIYVVYRTPKMRTLTNFYLVSLAAADCIVLLSGTLPAIPQFFFYQHQWHYGSVMCSIFIFLQYLGINASALSIMAFTIERYIGICHPMLAQVYFTSKRAVIIICGLWSFSLAYNAAWLYLATVKELASGTDILTCTYRINRDQYRAIYMVDLILFYVIPLILFCILYTLIAVRLHKSLQDMKKPLNPNASVKPTIQLLVMDKSINKDFRQSLMGDRKDTLKKMEKARFQVVKMLVVIATLFAVLWLPYRAAVVYNSFAPDNKRYSNKWYFIVARIMVFLNSAMNPLLYRSSTSQPLNTRRRSPAVHKTVVRLHSTKNGTKDSVSTSLESGEGYPLTLSCPDYHTVPKKSLPSEDHPQA